MYQCINEWFLDQLISMFYHLRNTHTHKLETLNFLYSGIKHISKF